MIHVGISIDFSMFETWSLRENYKLLFIHRKKSIKNWFENQKRPENTYTLNKGSFASNSFNEKNKFLLSTLFPQIVTKNESDIICWHQNFQKTLWSFPLEAHMNLQSKTRNFFVSFCEKYHQPPNLSQKLRKLLACQTPQFW